MLGMPAAGSSSSSTFGSSAKCNRDLHQPLASVGDLAHRAMHVGLQLEVHDQRLRAFEQSRFSRAAGFQIEKLASGGLRHGDEDVLEHGQLREQAGDLEGAHQPLAGARGRIGPGHLLAEQVQLARVGAAARP